MTRTDRELLAAIAEYRVLTVRQIARLMSRNTRVVQRRLADLGNEGLVLASSRGYGRGRGRPEKLISLSEQGIGVLRSKGAIGPGVSNDRVMSAAIRCLDHQLLVNSFRIELARVGQVVPGLSVRFLSPTSPFLALRSDGYPSISDHVSVSGCTDKRFWFTPDGVFSISDDQRRRTVLFFLEVDMGTETLASPKRSRRDLRQKILNYREYFRSERYKRYEETWSCDLRGFRLLFVTHTADRLAAVCRLVRDMRPSDFVWLTDQDRLAQAGVCSRIWARGGRLNASLESILGSRAPAPP
ncbi:MAG: replication-relaxation family protein [Phycisphaerae bacterium]|nr:replication-relaxation family protein [Phycisphaerae bacterium]